MAFTLFVAHNVIGDKRVVEEFEGVEAFDDPPMTDSLHIAFEADDRDDRRLSYGNVIRAKQDNE